MNIEKSINNLKKYIEEDFVFREPIKNMSDFDRYCWNHCKDIETLLTAYEKEKRLAEANLKDSEEFQENMCNHRCILNSKVEELETELEKEKEKNKELEKQLQSTYKKQYINDLEAINHSNVSFN